MTSVLSGGGSEHRRNRLPGGWPRVAVGAVTLAAMGVLAADAGPRSPGADIAPEDLLDDRAMALIERAVPSPDCSAEPAPPPADDSLVPLDVVRVREGCLTATVEHLPADQVEDRQRELAADPSVVAAAVARRPDLAENIDYRDEQWGPDVLGGPEGWVNPPWPDGSGAVVAVLDTGIDASHPDLDGAVIGRRDFPDEPAKGSRELHPHGTHVAGIIAANAGDGGIVGVAPGARLLDVPVEWDVPTNAEGLNRGAATIVSGIEWAVNHGADVINMSLGLPLSTEAGTPLLSDQLVALAAVVAYAQRHDVVLVASGGNCGSPDWDDFDKTCQRVLDAPMAPAIFAPVLTVGAVTREVRPAEFTSRNETVDLMAPGAEVISTVPENKYRFVNGSSQAAPHFSAAAPVLRAADPDASAAQVSTALRETGLPLLRPRDRPGTGAGVIDIPEALEHLETSSPGERGGTGLAFVQKGTLYALVDGVAHPVRRVDPESRPFTVDFSADGRWLVGTNDGVLFSWNGPKSSPVERPCEDCSVTYVDGPGGGHVAVVRGDGRFTRVDPATLERGEQRQLRLPNPDYSHYRLHGDVGGLLLVSHPRTYPSGYGGPDTLWLIDPATGKARASHTSDDNTAITQVAVSTDGRRVAFTSYSHGGSCYETGHVTVLDGSDLRPAAQPAPPVSRVDNLTVHDIFYNGRRLYAVMSAQRARADCSTVVPTSLWRLASRRWRKVPTDPFTAMRPVEGLTGTPTTGIFHVDADGRAALRHRSLGEPVTAFGGHIDPRWIWSAPTRNEVDVG